MYIGLESAKTFEQYEIETSYMAYWNHLKLHQAQWLYDLDHDLYAKISHLDFVSIMEIHVSELSLC